MPWHILTSGGRNNCNDLSKIVNPHLKIDNVKLLIKEGGKTGLWKNPDGLPNFLKDFF